MSSSQTPRKPMRICVLQPSYELSQSEFKETDDLDCSPARLLPGHQVDSYFLHKAQGVATLTEIALKNQYDLYINLCDGAFEEDRAGVEVVQTLEKLNVPYTGASSSFYGMDKRQMKLSMQLYGIPTPAFNFAFDLHDVEVAAAALEYPMMVKHFNGGGSLGMSKDSRVTNKEGLFREARRMIDDYGGCLIEEFIEGKEFTVLVAENSKDTSDPIAFVPVECAFPPGESFKHFHLKFESADSIIWKPVEDDTLSQRLKEVSKATFLAVGGNSYGRCDIRMKPNGDLFMLEINANCGIFYPDIKDFGSADFILHYDKQIGHQKFVELIVDTAVLSHEKKQTKSLLRFDKRYGMGMYAKCSIEAGETINFNENTPMQMMSYQHAVASKEMNSLPAIRQVIQKYARPAGDNLVALPTGSDPYTWQCYNQSDDPNAQYEGLNVVATRQIKRGEQITVPRRHDPLEVANKPMDKNQKWYGNGLPHVA